MADFTFRPEVLAKWITGGTAAQGFIAAPGSGATITIWDSNANGKTPNGGARFKLLIFSLKSSADSAASGLSFEESHDDGTNWDVVTTFTTLAVNYEKKIVGVSAPRVRVRYTNSAAVLTTWRGSLIGDEYERSQT